MAIANGKYDVPFPVCVKLTDGWPWPESTKKNLATMVYRILKSIRTSILSNMTNPDKINYTTCQVNPRAVFNLQPSMLDLITQCAYYLKKDGEFSYQIVQSVSYVH